MCIDKRNCAHAAVPTASLQGLCGRGRVFGAVANGFSDFVTVGYCDNFCKFFWIKTPGKYERSVSRKDAPINLAKIFFGKLHEWTCDNFRITSAFCGSAFLSSIIQGTCNKGVGRRGLYGLRRLSCLFPFLKILVGLTGGIVSVNPTYTNLFRFKFCKFAKPRQ